MSYLRRLQEAFPPATYANSLRAVREGIATADDAIKGIPFLDTPIGRDYRGLLRRAGVIFRFDEMCKAGDLPFQAIVSPMPRGNWHWLEIFSGDIIAHIVRTEEPDAFPEDTPNRQDQRDRNQGDLFDDPKVVKLASRRLYAWLCFRATPNGALAHALWGMPSARKDGEEDSWLARINLMAEVAARKSEDEKRPAKVHPKTRMKLRDHAQELADKKKKNSDEKK